MIVLALLLATQPAQARAPAAPASSTDIVASDFRPDLFFEGRTRGTGTLRIATSARPRPLAVEGTGRIEPDGALVLDQAVTLNGKTSDRSFRLLRVADARTGRVEWQCTLTDAVGPVVVQVDGNRMTLVYHMKGAGRRLNQTLDLAPDGRTVRNVATVTMFGIRVARIEETIEKLEP